MKRFVKNYPDKTIYDCDEHMCNMVYFKDCPLNGTEEVSGRGAIVNRFSSLLFKKLAALGINNHFVRILNMRESIVRKANKLPFDVSVSVRSCKSFQKRYGIKAGTIFEDPLIEYSHESNILSHGHISSFEWLDHDEIDDLELFISRIVSFLRGIFMGFSMDITRVSLKIGREMNEDDDFVLLGDLSPETISIKDIQTDEMWGMDFLSASDNPIIHYKKMATSIGLYIGSGNVSKVITLASRQRDITKPIMSIVE